RGLERLWPEQVQTPCLAVQHPALRGRGPAQSPRLRNELDAQPNAGAPDLSTSTPQLEPKPLDGLLVIDPVVNALERRHPVRLCDESGGRGSPVTIVVRHRRRHQLVWKAEASSELASEPHVDVAVDAAGVVLRVPARRARNCHQDTRVATS